MSDLEKACQAKAEDFEWCTDAEYREFKDKEKDCQPLPDTDWTSLDAISIVGADPILTHMPVFH